jgi:hypothetical protein
MAGNKNNHTMVARSSGLENATLRASLEKLNFTLMLFGCTPGVERPQVAALSSLRINLARIEPILASS